VHTLCTGAINSPGLPRAADRKEVAAVSAAVRMQMALANLRLWVALVGTDERPTIHPERVTEAIGALEAGLVEIRGDEAAARDEESMAVMDQAAIISQVQEQVMKQGVALPADIIAMVLEAEEELLCDCGAIVIEFAHEEERDAEDDGL
ncbi:MAG: hypothetical protein JWN15_455, partial [Firmicutes bacterium]|nr:hypothetical protein [Bacillota bacterium]